MLYRRVLLALVLLVSFDATSALDKCTLCESVGKFLTPLLRTKPSIEVISAVADEICHLFKIQCINKATCDELCNSIVHEYAKEFIGSYVAPDVACRKLKLCSSDVPYPPAPSPTGDVPMAANLSDMAGVHAWPSWNKTEGRGYYLHITDIHLDPEYEPGAKIDCGLPLCCRNGSGSAGSNVSNAAGFWGSNKAGPDSGCDTPPWLIDDAMAKLAGPIQEERPLDFILYTGDSPPHDVWAQSRASNTAAIHAVTAYFSRYFPGVPVLSALGNHEAFPVNQYQGRADGLTAGGDTWLYDTVAQDWAHWLPDQALRTLRYGGFYAARAMPNLVVISMNNNMFQAADTWWAFNHTDVNNQFPFLIDALKQTRALGLKAIIIGHEHGLDGVWERYMHEVIHNFTDIVIGQHYGHAHSAYACAWHDYTNSDGREGAAPGTPLHSVYIGNSVTPYAELNPGFAIFHYDRSLPGPNLADDFEEYWLNLTEANLKNSTEGWLKPAWRATEEYGIPDVSPASWVALSERLRTDPALYQRFITNRNKGVFHEAPADPTADACGLAECDQGEFERCSGLSQQRPQVLEHKC